MFYLAGKSLFEIGKILQSGYVVHVLLKVSKGNHTPMFYMAGKSLFETRKILQSGYVQ
jgi:hypothetical protein